MSMRKEREEGQETVLYLQARRHRILRLGRNLIVVEATVVEVDEAGEIGEIGAAAGVLSTKIQIVSGAGLRKVVGAGTIEKIIGIWSLIFGPGILEKTA